MVLIWRCYMLECMGKGAVFHQVFWTKLHTHSSAWQVGRRSFQTLHEDWEKSSSHAIPLSLVHIVRDYVDTDRARASTMIEVVRYLRYFDCHKMLLTKRLLVNSFPYYRILSKKNLLYLNKHCPSITSLALATAYPLEKGG